MLQEVDFREQYYEKPDWCTVIKFFQFFLTAYKKISFIDYCSENAANKILSFKNFINNALLLQPISYFK